jgi:hypothetical protein
MLFNVANGRVLRNETVRENAMQSMLEIASQVVLWTNVSTLHHFSKSTLELAQQCFSTAWLCFPNNTFLPARCAQLLRPALSTKSVSANVSDSTISYISHSLMEYTFSLVHKLPGNVTGQCVLPELSNALLSLVPHMPADDWLSLTLQFLYHIKDFRENTDELLELHDWVPSSRYFQQKPQQHGEIGDVDHEDVDDENDGSDDEDNDEDALPTFRVHEMKVQEKTEKKNKYFGKKEMENSKQKSSFDFAPVHTHKQVDCVVADKFLYGNETFALLSQQVRMLLHEDLQHSFADLTEQQAYRVTLSTQAMQWFSVALPKLIFVENQSTIVNVKHVDKKSSKQGDIQTEIGLISNCLQAVKNMHVEFERVSSSLSVESLAIAESRSSKERLELALYYLLQLFVTVSQSRLANSSIDSSISSDELRSVWLKWIKSLCRHLQQQYSTENERVLLLSQFITSGKPYLNSHTSALSFWTLGATVGLLQGFQANVPDTPRDFLSQLLSTEDCNAIVMSLSLPLSSASYWMKLTAVKMLSFFPVPTDDDVELGRSSEQFRSRERKREKSKSIDDSDEDIDMETNFDKDAHKSKVHHVYDVAAIFLEILRLPVHLKNEREILRRLEILEVWSRPEKLALLPHYLATIVAFSLSIFHIKLQSLWPAAINVLHTAAEGNLGETVLWPILSQALFQSLSVNEDIKDIRGNVTNSTGFSLQSTWSLLAENSSGIQPYPMTSIESVLFPVALGKHTLNRLAIKPDSRTDTETVSLSLLQVLKKTPAVTLKRSKIVVSLFLSFLQHDYYALFNGEPEIFALIKLGVLQLWEAAPTVVVTGRTCRRRLEGFLSIFAAVPSPKQLFKHTLLFALYNELLCKPDLSITNLALDCILTYKPPSVAPYRDCIKRIFDDKTLRNELLTMTLEGEMDSNGQLISSHMENILIDGQQTHQQRTVTVVSKEHQNELFPILIRILFGRLLSKPSSKRGGDRESNTSKRTAVLAFISRMDCKFIGHFLHLMMRGVLGEDMIELLNVGKNALVKKNSIKVDDNKKHDAIVKVDEAQSVRDYLADGYSAVSNHVLHHLSTNGLTKVSWERLQGFLFLLEPVISILGFRLTSYLPVMEELLMQVFSLAHSCRERSLENFRADDIDEFDESDHEISDEEDEQDSAKRNESYQAAKVAKLSATVRSLILNRFSGEPSFTLIFSYFIHH